MRTWLSKGLVVFGLVAGVASCGGGATSSPTAAPQAAFTAPQRAAAPAIDGASLFAWAEVNYPQFFSGPSQDGVFDVYTYRAYPATGNYIGISDGRVYVYGPVSGGAILFVGRQLNFSCAVQPSDCDPSRPLSSLQAKWESFALGSNTYSFTFLSSTTPFGTATSNFEYFMADRNMPVSPLTQSNGMAQSYYKSSEPFVGGSSVPSRFTNCSGVQSAPSTAYPYFTIVLDDTGSMARNCGNAPITIQYLGDAIYYHAVDTTGRPYATRQMTDIATVDLSGQNILAFLKSQQGAPGLSQISPSSAVFPPGSMLGQVSGLRPYAYMTVRDVSYSWSEPITPIQASGQPPGGTSATSLEQAFPWKPITSSSTIDVSAGQIHTLNGRRVWTQTSPANTNVDSPRQSLVELNGLVYRAEYYVPATTTERLFTFYNSIAKQAILAAGLTWQ